MKFLIFAFFIFIFLFQNKSYAQDTLSPPNPGGVTKIYISLIVNNINEINASDQTITADIIITARWNDPRLKHSNKENIVVTPDMVWDPFLTITNRLNVTSSFPEKFIVQQDGTVLYFQRLYGKFTQHLNFKEFPFDQQDFSIRILDLTLNPEEVELEQDTLIKSGLGEEISISDWDLVSWKFEKSKYSALKDANKRSTLLFTINAKRESGFYLLIFIIPLGLIIMMSLLAFWLPPNLSASQIAIGTTSMLTLIAYRFVITSELPKISYMTRMDIFILGSSILIFLTLLESVLTSTLASKGSNELSQKIDQHSRWIFPLLYLFVGFLAFWF